jgi:hypothetical protein
MFETEQKLIRKYKLKDGENLELWSVGSGATDVDDIWLLKKQVNQKTNDTVCNLLGYNEKYMIGLRQINDSLVRIVLSDTSKFRTSNDSSVRIINLNKKVITYNYSTDGK